MKLNLIHSPCPWRAAVCILAAAPLSFLSAFGQDSAEDNEIIELSPFEVDTSKDVGYRATNTISGSRLNTSIKDIPMPIEVITEEFVDDIGASDLREALKYSSGILMTTQNDAGKGNSTVGSGGVHNPEGATANKTNTSYKVRGFVTDSTLRAGYRRQIASDAVNISRVDVIRGPSALLYGIGNFGGIVNYIPKTPAAVREQETSFSIGSNGHQRATYEGSQPLGTPWDFKFLITAAYEKNDSYTELAKDSHMFYSPVLTFSPTSKTDVLIGYEDGDYDSSGQGFKSVRVNGNLDLSNAAEQQDRLEHSGYLVFSDNNADAEKQFRTMRLSGPDQYLNTDFNNLRVEVTQNVIEGLDVLVGYNEADIENDSRDFGGSVAAALVGNATHDRFAGPALVLTSNGDVAPAVNSDGVATPMLGQGTESTTFEKLNRQQLRTEVNYKFDTFRDSENLKMTHSFLLGQSVEKSRKNVYIKDFADGEFNYFDPSQYIQFRSGLNSDGSVGFLPSESSVENTVSSNTGQYFVYHGKFWHDKINVVYGRRRDQNDVDNVFTDLRAGTAPDRTISPEQTDYTNQFGVSLEIIPQLTVFALQAEGVDPNFDGKRDLNGDAIKASTAKSEEFGLKFELFDGKLSGTISKYKIEQIGKATSYWWAPANGKSYFNRDENIIYNVNNFSPSAVDGGSNGGNGAADASFDEWEAARQAGAAFQDSPVDEDGNTVLGDDGLPVVNWYLNASTPEGAAYMNSVFYKTRGVEEVNGELVNVDYGEDGNPYAGWAGWLYMRDSIVNAAFEDWAAPDNGWDAWSPSNEESEGLEVNLTYQPFDNWQMVFTGAKTERSVTKVFDMVRYEWGDAGIDRWATWFYPDGSWGLTGAMAPNEAYSDEANGDTSTWNAVGLLQGEPQDDTPEYHMSFWNSFTFTENTWGGVFDGLQLAGGFWWQDEREFESGITDGSGQIAIDPDTGRPFNKKHDARLEVNAMAKYSFETGGNSSYLQLNINNLLNDTDRYGWVNAPGTSWRLQFGVEF